MQDVSALTFPAEIDPNWRVGIVRSHYHGEITEGMEEGARNVFMEAGLDASNIITAIAPGAFEIPLIGQHLLKKQKVDALIGLGIILQGQTAHADLIAAESARGIMDIQIQEGVPFVYEILVVSDLEQARERSTGEHNKGVEAAYAVLHSLAQIAALGRS